MGDSIVLVLTWQARPEDLSLLRQHLPPEVEVVGPGHTPDEDEYTCHLESLLPLVAEAHAAMGWIVPDEAIRAGRRLKLVQTLHAGVDHMNLELFREKGILLANVAGASSIAIGEHTMALILALAKRILRNHQAALQSRPTRYWVPETASVQLSGKTLGIVGLGAIGSAVARLAKAFDMTVYGYKRTQTSSLPFVDDLYVPPRMDDMLALSDIVVVSLPLTKETQNLLSRRQFGTMKEDALLINVGRAEVINEFALAQALETKTIAGFASDVWWRYSPGTAGTYYGYPSHVGIHLLPNVVISPDVAGNTLETREAMITLAAKNVAAFARGDRIPLLVDLSAGY